MAEKWPRFGHHGGVAKLGACVNWVNWLRTSADKRMWFGRRAVVMVGWAAVGCGCSALIHRFSWTGDWGAGHEGYPPPDCSGQGEGQSFLASSWASRAVAAATLFQTCFACVHMYILYACVYICECVDVCGHDICIYMHVCMYLYIYVFMHMCICMCMHICAWIVGLGISASACGRCHACACVFVCMCMRICMCVGIYICAFFLQYVLHAL